MQYAGQNNFLIRFDIAVSVHNVAGILLTVNYLQFFIGNIFTKNIRFYKINWKEIRGQVLMQMKYYSYGIFKGEKPPFTVSAERKFNPLQQVSYIAVMYIIVPLIFVTGWALLFPEIIIPKFLGVSGLLLTDLLHVIMGFLVSLFMIIHIYFCTTGTKFGSIFKSMITGWSEVH
jgi:thiosulfate reductase cytochrome b subunit